MNMCYLGRDMTWVEIGSQNQAKRTCYVVTGARNAEAHTKIDCCHSVNMRTTAGMAEGRTVQVHGHGKRL